MYRSLGFFRGLFLFSSLLLLTAHTLVPHVHSSPFLDTGKTSVGVKSEKDRNWLDVLADFVDTDMGEDHLEHFSPEQGLDLDLTIPAIVPTFPPATLAVRMLVEQEEPRKYSGWNFRGPPLLRSALMRVSSLRGPPTLA